MKFRKKPVVIDAIHSAHVKKLDSDLMDIRVFVAQITTTKKISVKEVCKLIDKYIYEKQESI